MHAVNNGPSCEVGDKHLGWGAANSHIRNGNLAEFTAAGIPYARTHDSSVYPKYGLEHTVDVAFIFPNFDADPYAPASYDFTCTDHYMDMIEASGAKIFYRLGHRIEHEVKKYGTLPPKDFKKWAIICEHIIRHYTEGWAEGSFRDIEYWEIWNEPDLDEDDAKNKRTWGGTKKEFFEFYSIVANHLKGCFPHLKIGGPAIAHGIDWTEEFLKGLKAPLDFFSWHCYSNTLEKAKNRANDVRNLLDKYGFTKTESILNEWNYVKGWQGDDMAYSRLSARGEKGAAFNLANMCYFQAGNVDMLMYYDARPCNWNGLFDFLQVGKNTTTAYWSFVMFNELYKLGGSVEVSFDGDNYIAAAKRGNEGAIVMTRYNDDDSTPSEIVTVDINGFSSEGGVEAKIYVLDGNHDMTLYESLVFFGDRFIWKPDMPNFTSYLIKLKKL
jgi:hypothetical protein